MVAILGGSAAAAEMPPTRWASRAWELNDVIPGDGAGGSVRGIVQEAAGTLIVATTVGLVRFDGDAFTPVPLELPPGEQPQVLHVARSQSGECAVVLASGCLVWVDASHVGRSVAPPPDEAGVAATSLVIDRQGRAWIANERGGVWRVDPDGECRVVVAGTGDPAGRAHLAIAIDGTIWVTVKQSLAIVRDDRLEPIAAIPAGLSVLTTADGGGMWLTVQGEVFRYERDGTRRAIVPTAATFSSPPIKDVIGTVRSLSGDAEGRLWLCSSRYGLFVLENGVLTQVDVGETWVTSAIHDREGSIWVGTRLAIHRIQPAIAWPTSLPTWRPIIDLVSDGQGRTWCLTQNGEIGTWFDDQPEDFTLSPELGRERGLCLDATSAGVVWVGLANGRLRRIDSGAATTESLPPPHDSAMVTGLLASTPDDLWVMTDNALLRRQDGEWRVVQVPTDPAPSPQTTAASPSGRIESHLAAGPTGTVWVVAGTLVGRVAADDHALTPIPTAALGTARPGRIVAADEDRLWIVLKSTGLARWNDSRWSVVTAAHGLPPEDIVGTAFDQQGRLWCATPRMLFVVARDELERVADGAADRCHCWVLPPRHETDFLESLATPVCAMLPLSDGRLLAARQSGLVVCDPARLQGSAAPPVAVRRVRSDQAVGFVSTGVGPGPSPAPVAVLPSAARRVHVDFRAATLRSPSNVLVEYRLDGIDDAWVTAPLSGRAAYATLPPGSHAFWLRSSDHASRWEPTEPAITIQVTPPFWETWWFRTLALATAAGVAAAAGVIASAVRTRRRLAALRQQAAVDRERMRLARDMHDEVGTNLTQIALLTEVALGDAGPPLADHLEMVARISRETVGSLDELVWAVDPGNDTLPHLLSYVCRYASETLREFGVQCDVLGPGLLPPSAAPGDFRRGLLLIVKEAITNVIAHAEASQVALRLELRGGLLVVEIADDGQGFGRSSSANGAGLGNMQHRAEALGGHCRVEPGPDGGTTVRVELPVAAATTAKR